MSISRGLIAESLPLYVRTKSVYGAWYHFGFVLGAFCSTIYLHKEINFNLKIRKQLNQIKKKSPHKYYFYEFRERFFLLLPPLTPIRTYYTNSMLVTCDKPCVGDIYYFSTLQKCYYALHGCYHSTSVVEASNYAFCHYDFVAINHFE